MLSGPVVPNAQGHCLESEAHCLVISFRDFREAERPFCSPKGPFPLPAGGLKFAHPDLSLHVKGSDPHWSAGILVKETPSDLSYSQHGVSGFQILFQDGRFGWEQVRVWTWRVFGEDGEPMGGNDSQKRALQLELCLAGGVHSPGSPGSP